MSSDDEIMEKRYIVNYGSVWVEKVMHVLDEIPVVGLVGRIIMITWRGQWGILWKMLRDGGPRIQNKAIEDSDSV